MYGFMLVMWVLGRNLVRNKNSLENFWILLFCVILWYVFDDDLKEC